MSTRRSSARKRAVVTALDGIREHVGEAEVVVVAGHRPNLAAADRRIFGPASIRSRFGHNRVSARSETSIGPAFSSFIDPGTPEGDAHRDAPDREQITDPGHPTNGW